MKKLWLSLMKLIGSVLPAGPVIAAIVIVTPAVAVLALWLPGWVEEGIVLLSCVVWLGGVAVLSLVLYLLSDTYFDDLGSIIWDYNYLARIDQDGNVVSGTRLFRSEGSKIVKLDLPRYDGSGMVESTLSFRFQLADKRVSVTTGAVVYLRNNGLQGKERYDIPDLLNKADLPAKGDVLSFNGYLSEKLGAYLIDFLRGKDIKDKEQLREQCREAFFHLKEKSDWHGLISIKYTKIVPQYGNIDWRDAIVVG